jgi:hypothetical protein
LTDEMATPDAATVYAKWQANSTNAADAYVAGVQNTDKDIVALAITAIPRMRQNVLAAIDDGRVANGLRKVGTQGIKDAVAAKGKVAFTNGIAGAQTKFEASFAPLLTYIDGVKRQIAQMPNLTDADRDARMLKNVALMRQYKTGS